MTENKFYYVFADLPKTHQFFKVREPIPEKLKNELEDIIVNELGNGIGKVKFIETGGEEAKEPEEINIEFSRKEPIERINEDGLDKTKGQHYSLPLIQHGLTKEEANQLIEYLKKDPNFFNIKIRDYTIEEVLEGGLCDRETMDDCGGFPGEHGYLNLVIDSGLEIRAVARLLL